MLEKSGEVDGIHIEWHTLEHDGKKITACFSDPDEPSWEFWCGKRKVTILSNSEEGSFAVIAGEEGSRPNVFDSMEQDDAANAFIWLVA